MKLSEEQEKALQKMKPGDWYSAYDLQCRINTLYALKRKGHVQIRGHDHPGAYSWPRSMIEFAKTAPLPGRKDKQMVNDQKTIEQILSQAENIYSIEGGNRVMLVYQDDGLYQNAPLGGLAFKPISDVQSIVYIEALNAWQVTWTV